MDPVGAGGFVLDSLHIVAQGRLGDFPCFPACQPDTWVTHGAARLCTSARAACPAGCKGKRLRQQ
ncbi:hypothetical protein CRM82_14730 [Comamonas terrigena]|uniref:Uncharacterized protein n=1 Tax=Comamonas terrigena TaxID=32013 RepID=A0A2A7UWJ3_COMTR|nr:hypothetical protein [Comamonas terrigena]PEH89685.1 hypothetical protein CRM82_14730 [Comamonas terrigena]